MGGGLPSLIAPTTVDLIDGVSGRAAAAAAMIAAAVVQRCCAAPEQPDGFSQSAPEHSDQAASKAEEPDSLRQPPCPQCDGFAPVPQPAQPRLRDGIPLVGVERAQKLHHPLLRDRAVRVAPSPPRGGAQRFPEHEELPARWLPYSANTLGRP